MHRALVPVAALTLLYAIWNIGTDSYSISFGWGVDWGYLALQLFYWPAVVAAWLCAISSLILIFRKTHRSLGVISLALALPMTGYSLYHPKYSTLKKWHHQGELRERWFQSSQILNHLLMKYLEEYPNGISWPGEDEQIDAGNFVRHLEDSLPVSYRAHEGKYRVTVKNGQVLSPWGAPILFGVDRDGDGYIAFGGKRASLKAGYADPWADGNFSYQAGVGCLPLEIPPAIFEPGAEYLSTLNDRDFRRLFRYRETERRGGR
jgi:hypothetical protein